MKEGWEYTERIKKTFFLKKVSTQFLVAVELLWAMLLISFAKQVQLY